MFNEELFALLIVQVNFLAALLSHSDIKKSPHYFTVSFFNIMGQRSDNGCEQHFVSKEYRLVSNPLEFCLFRRAK